MKDFVKVIPTDYKKVLLKEKAEAAKAKAKATSEYLKKFRSNQEVDDEVNTLLIANQKAKEQEKKKSITISNKATLKEPKVVDLEDAVPDSKQLEKNSERIEKTRGFMIHKRRHETHRDPRTRVNDWKEFTNPITKKDAKYQTARCMDCGTPFCLSDTGCPLSNIIPKFNELLFKNQWKLALDKLLETNNFPEFTGRVCPAPCEGACTLGIIEDPVGIKSVERIIIDHAFKEGWIKPCPPSTRTGFTVGVIGSGPAGLACADMLNRAGHTVTVYERSDRCGG